jgi:glutamyl-Q tRNA(Asp) synthetase
VTGRFAPTPSGRMHIGNVYAMLGAWLSARSRGDRMLMRIEDVDKPRVAAGADQLMMDDLHWLGLDWDGEPMFQSQRTERYEYALECLRSQGVLYPCFCSRADIRAASAPNEGDGFMVYPGTCRRLLHDHPDEVRARLVRGDQHSIRIAMPESAAGEKQRTVPDDSAALSGAVPPEQQGDAGIVDGVACFNDRVYSPQHYDLAREVGDSVIRRADGLFGYQLVVVVDDLDMGVDDIVRGRDLLRSTALQMWIRQCLLAGGF